MQSDLDLDALRVTDKSSALQIVCPAFDIVLYMNRNLSAIGTGVLHAYDRFLDLSPAEERRWYITETMKKHAPCTQRALDLLRVWLKSGAPKRDVIHIEIKGGKDHAASSDIGFWVYGDERGGSYEDDAEVIRLIFPAERALENPEELLELAIDLCDHLPYRSGHAGYVLQTTRYLAAKSEAAAWKLASRHPGLDIRNELRDRIAVNRDGIKGVNWLTVLCDEFVDRVGGRKALKRALSAPIEQIPVKGGLIIKAGPAPAIGDLNRGDKLPLFQSVYRVLEQLQQPTVDRYGAFDLPGDASDKTDSWLKRFAE